MSWPKEDKESLHMDQNPFMKSPWSLALTLRTEEEPVTANFPEIEQSKVCMGGY